VSDPLPPPAPRGDRLVVVMVGLPARGKTYTARKLERYLRWHGRQARVFNVGNYRRERLGAQQPADFFDPSNPQGLAQRRAMAEAAMDDMLAWLDDPGEVGIYDATNSTHVRRAWVRERCEQAGCRVLFVESICDDPAVLEHNIRETKLRSPDYRHMDPEAAVADFKRRIAMYEDAYETIDEDDASWVKLVDAGRRIVVNRLQGYLPSRLVTLLMNLHLTSRPIWLTRHGQSVFNVDGRLGGDPGLTEAGRTYARALAEFVDARADEELVVWSSTLERTRQTARLVGRPSRAWRALDEIDAGIFDGLTYAGIAQQAPDQAEARRQDKLRYRYPNGESYEDVIRRLDPVILEMERQRRPLLVIGHNAVIRALYGYFADVPVERIPHLPIPLHTVIELTPRAYGVAETRHRLVDAVGDAPSG